jgi:hypothetical protein
MKRRSKFWVAGGTFVVLGVGWYVYKIIFVTRHIPEAYAAWDTGTLLVEYMKGHDNRWPTSWDDLLTVLDSQSGRHVLLRGSQAGDLAYARGLRNLVSVDWSFDPEHPDDRRPVTRRDGGSFPVVWADPNEMVREQLNKRAATVPS